MVRVPQSAETADDPQRPALGVDIGKTQRRADHLYKLNHKPILYSVAEHEQQLHVRYLSERGAGENLCDSFDHQPFFGLWHFRRGKKCVPPSL
ncbi:hypothetical protein BGZ75_005504 [Mortierella antarctica]|nr:hypothetical protein BGZ75_005504 [Mortierella antarctica]